MQKINFNYINSYSNKKGSLTGGTRKKKRNDLYSRL